MISSFLCPFPCRNFPKHDFPFQTSLKEQQHRSLIVMAIALRNVLRSVDETLPSSGHSVLNVLPAAPGAAQDCIRHIKDTCTSTHQMCQDNATVELYVSQGVSRHPRRIPVILKDRQGKESFYKQPRKELPEAGLGGAACIELNAKSYRVAGGGGSRHERCTHAPSLLPRPRSGSRCVKTAAPCPRTAGGSRAARASRARHLQP